MSTLKLQSFDKEIFEVDIQVVKHSSVLKHMLDNMKRIDDGNNDPILLSEVSSNILRKVLEYCTYHKNDIFIEEDEDASEKKSDDFISEWDQEFLDKLDQTTLSEVMLASDYLEMKGLMHVSCKYVANQIRKKTQEEIRAVLAPKIISKPEK